MIQWQTQSRDFLEINPSTQPNHIHCTDSQFGVIDISTHRVNIQTFHTALEIPEGLDQVSSHQLKEINLQLNLGSKGISLNYFSQDSEARRELSDSLN